MTPGESHNEWYQYYRSNFTFLTKHWNISKEFFIPNDITLYRYSPSGITNDEISFALFVNGICKIILSRSNFVAYLAIQFYLLLSPYLSYIDIVLKFFHILVLQEYWVLSESRIQLKSVLVGGVIILALSISSHEQTQ